MHLNLPAAELSDDDWNAIEQAFAPGSIFLDVLYKLRAAHNAPQKACDLFDENLVNQGNEQMSAVLRAAGSPFRLSLIGNWRKGNRRERMLAIVRFPEAQLAKLKRNAAG